ncbi:ABC transporter ATP-binding protein [Streptococcus mutans]|uniref:ABC transporter ATP-binding protein n=1 Tax=Streptococcus mutans TaxID=1309 RepID=UPI0005172413|nr:ABC transporter ATP-binding protein [Streptococcus mutans]MCB4996011.1 ABC transporter ATP-binding protein [Streptococcus mutans]MDT9501965.1 ABC transporter ATP-binding protein [Streptococcus mutans]
MYYVGKKALTATHLSKSFRLDVQRNISVLKDISLSADYSEFISILGISGSGKSTLLKCLASLSEPTSGQVSINGVNPYGLRDTKLAKLRRQDISVIFQSYNLVPALPVLENIALPLRLSHKKVDKEAIRKLMRQLRFEASLDAFVSTLSGGEQQKVAIARTILSDSKVIFADEPTGALDSLSRQVIFDLLRQLANQGKCILMVTHDIELASQTDRSLILKDGVIHQELLKPTAQSLYQTLEAET